MHRTLAISISLMSVLLLSRREAASGFRHGVPADRGGMRRRSRLPLLEERRRCAVIVPATTTTTTVDGDDGDGGSRRYGALLDWVRSRGGEVSGKVALQRSSQGSGYGAFAADEIREGEVLFTVPREACLTLDAVTGDEKFGKAFGALMEKAGPGSSTVVMAGYMAKEYLLYREDAAAGGGSRWGPYFDTLPWERGVNNQEHVLFWPEDKVEELLAGSLCYGEARSLRGEVRLATKVLNSVLGPSIRAARGEEVDDGGGFRWPWAAKPPEPEAPPEGFADAMTGAFVCLLTRAFQDDDPSGGDGAAAAVGGTDRDKLVPLLDMLQHSDAPNVRHAMRKVDGTVEVRARCDISAGAELFNQYRSEEEESMPYSRFFTRFGFVPGITEDMENLLRDKSPIFYAQKAEI